jgi:hypothetical protein
MAQTSTSFGKSAGQDLKTPAFPPACGKQNKRTRGVATGRKHTIHEFDKVCIITQPAFEIIEKKIVRRGKKNRNAVCDSPLRATTAQIV